MQTLYENVLAKQAIDPAVETGNTAHASSIIDRKGYSSVMFVIAYGTLSDSGCTVTPSLEEGDDSGLSDTAAVTSSAYLVGTLAKATVDQDDDSVVRCIEYRGTKRYVRLTLTPSGNSGNIPLSAVALLGSPCAAPVSQSES